MSAVGDLLNKLNPWHKETPPPPPPPPPITTRTAALIIALYALVYFVPFYLSPTTRPSATLSRDAPSVVRARIRSVTLSCLLCTLVTYVVVSRPPPPPPGTPSGGPDGQPGGPVVTPREALHLLGLWPAALWDAGRVLVLTALLFLGPLFSYFFAERGWAEWGALEPVREVWAEWTTWRNIVAGPVTEEILFRTASIPLMLLASTPLTQTIFLTPVLFGLAHVHHLYEFRLTHPQVPLVAALARSVFQLAYTTLFGAYATFLFLRTGSLVAVCAVHAFCNCMGLPQVWGRVEPVPAPVPVPVPVMAGGDVGNGGNGGGGQQGGAARKRRQQQQQPNVLLWTVSYYVLLVTGAVLWWKNLWVLSESANALVPNSAFRRGAA